MIVVSKCAGFSRDLLFALTEGDVQIQSVHLCSLDKGFVVNQSQVACKHQISQTSNQSWIEGRTVVWKVLQRNVDRVEIKSIAPNLNWMMSTVVF